MTAIPPVGAPALRAFVDAGYTSVEELLAVDEKDLLALHGVGPKAIRLLKAAAAHSNGEGSPAPTRTTSA